MDKYIIQNIMQMDSRFSLDKNDKTGEEILFLSNPLGHHRPITIIRYLRLGETTKVGVIADYKDETRVNRSYLSMWDGREGMFLPGAVSDDSYYVPWMDCFALCCVGSNAEKPVYVYIPADKKDAWLTNAIMIFNKRASDANTDKEREEICFSLEFGPFLRAKDREDSPIIEIKMTKTYVEVCCASSSEQEETVAYRASINSTDRQIMNLPGRKRRAFSTGK